MMFMQYFAMGAVLPILSLYLKESLGFSGAQAGSIMAMSSIAALIWPVVGAMVADRLISAERLLALCHFLGAGLLYVLATQKGYTTVMVLYLANVLVLGPTVPLTNAITFHHHPEGSRKFGNIRVWGTVAWVVVAWAFGFLWLGQGNTDRLGHALILSAVSSLVLGLYALTLPTTGLVNQPERPKIFPADSLKVLIQPQILLICLVSLLIGIIDRYFYFGSAPYLRHIGFSDAAIMPAMSIGQIAEIAAMSMLAGVLARFRIKTVLAIGILAEIWRFTALAWGGSRLIIYSGLVGHGIAYAFYFTAVYIHLDNQCRRESRSGIHQLFAIITSGLGSVLAYMLGGFCLDIFVPSEGPANYLGFWLIPTAIAIAALVIVALGFKKNKPTG